MYEVQEEPYYLQVSITGDVDNQALYEAHTALMQHPQYPYKNSLWVFDTEFVCGFSNIDMFEMVSRIKTFYPVGGTKEKCALLASNNFHYAFLKLFSEEAEREGVPFLVKPFRSFLEAKAWLMTERPASSGMKRAL